MKNGVIGVIALLALFAPGFSFAQVLITEIMYDPAGADSGHEWVELYNAGASSVSLAHWKLLARGASHNIVAASSGELMAPHAYAVIAQKTAVFRSQYPDFGGSLYHAAFTLDNAGDTVELLDASSTPVDSAAYDSSLGGLGDGNSLQRAIGPDDAFSAHTPTPGAGIASGMIPPKQGTRKPVEKSAQKPVARTHSAASSSPQAADESVEAGEAASADAAPPAREDSYLWPIALFGIAVVAGAAIATARSYQKREWDIVEEIGEDV